MSDNINSMNYKQLRNEVQLLRDELAIMKRKYEDIIYNLDTDNFSSRFVKEQGDMKSAIEITAEGIKTKVSKEEMESTITQTANQIKVEVEKVTTETDNKLKNYATTAWTDDQITSKVEQYVTDLVDGEYVTNVVRSEINQTANEIYAYVSETKEDLETSISSISVTADGIESRVGDLEDGKYKGYTLFTQSANKFTFEGNVDVKSTDTHSNTLELSDGHIQLFPSDYSDSLVDLGMYKVGNYWEPRMRFGIGYNDNLTSGTGWIYKTTTGFGLMYNNGTSSPPTIELKNNGIYFNGEIYGLPTGGTGGTATAVFG
jgi:hypothetical protein